MSSTSLSWIVPLVIQMVFSCTQPYLHTRLLLTIRMCCALGACIFWLTFNAFMVVNFMQKMTQNLQMWFRTVSELTA